MQFLRSIFLINIYSNYECYESQKLSIIFIVGLKFNNFDTMTEAFLFLYIYI